MCVFSAVIHLITGILLLIYIMDVTLISESTTSVNDHVWHYYSPIGPIFPTVYSLCFLTFC